MLKYALRLEALNVNHCNLGAEGAAALAVALPSLPRLTRFSAYANGIGARGARALVTGLVAAGGDSALEHLDLRTNDVRGAVAGALVRQLAAGCPKLKTLDLGALWICFGALSSIYTCMSHGHFAAYT